MEWKEKGNEFFKLDLATLLSNRSAAYIKYGKPQEALDDAEDCVKLKPKWAKGYSRKGKALYELGRFKEALETYQEGLVIDGSNQILREGMVECEEKVKEENDDYEEDKGKEQDDVDNFLNEINELEDTKKKLFTKPKQKSRFTLDHKAQTDNWNTKNQISRILCEKYEWNNLNPFEVLALPHTASEHDIKRRYKKLSQLLHPDKLKISPSCTTIDAEELKKNAEKAFDQLQQANGKLKNDKLRVKILNTIERVSKRVKESRERLIRKGMSKDELQSESEEIDVEVKKEFATIEHKRMKSESLKRKYEFREKENKKKEKSYWQKIKNKELEFRKQREDRIKEWKQFAKDGEDSKKQGFDYDKTSRVKQDLKKKREDERKVFKGYGVDESYKNDWR